MKAILAILLCLAPWSALADQLTFSVQRGDCGAPPEDWKGMGDVRHEWLSPSTLRVVTWVTESASEQVIDGSALLHSAGDAQLHLSYAEKFTPIAAGTPVLACVDFVRLQFDVSGVEKRDYAITLEKRSLVATATLVAN
ncbi:hypothetical protein [Arenimonas sp.]|uniref:hypothetical protein n=1 Tax=Arenimonas sp. TaxID=1872635 RepID=UPI002E35B103|nr:hypothetical protein [Arenimonas sp.]HEX4854765.1 hypothetical protein [Arenimonas sp.]